MERRNIVIENPRGLHLRVAAEIVKLARENGAQVKLTRDEERSASGDSVIELLLLDAGQGTTVKIEVTGGNEQNVATKISDLFSDGAGI